MVMAASRIACSLRANPRERTATWSIEAATDLEAPSRTFSRTVRSGIGLAC